MKRLLAGLLIALSTTAQAEGQDYICYGLVDQKPTAVVTWDGKFFFLRDDELVTAGQACEGISDCKFGIDLQHPNYTNQGAAFLLPISTLVEGTSGTIALWCANDLLSAQD